MNKFSRIFALIVFIFFEIYAGIRLLTNPVDFTNSVVIIFGIVMIVVGLISLFKAFSAKSKKLPYRITLVGAIVDLAIGILCAVFSRSVIGFFPIMVKIYGVIMIIMGINKIRHYAVLSDLGIKNTWPVLLSGILTILIGAFIFLFPHTSAEVYWTYAGILLIVEGVADLFALIFIGFIKR